MKKENIFKQEKEDKNIIEMNNMVQLMGNEEDKNKIIKVDESNKKDYQHTYEPGFVFEQLATHVEDKKEARRLEKLKDE